MERIKELLYKILENKWHGESDKHVADYCEFCIQSGYDCRKCLCPPSICHKGAHGGLISAIIKNHEKKIQVRHISPVELQAMRELILSEIEKL